MERERCISKGGGADGPSSTVEVYKLEESKRSDSDGRCGIFGRSRDAAERAASGVRDAKSFESRKGSSKHLKRKREETGNRFQRGCVLPFRGRSGGTTSSTVNSKAGLNAGCSMKIFLQ